MKMNNKKEKKDYPLQQEEVKSLEELAKKLRQFLDVHPVE